MKLAAALDVPRPRPEWLRLKLPSFVALLVLWQAASMLIADPVLFPSPWATLEAAYVHLMTGALPFSLMVTLARVAVAFFFAMVLGSAIGIALGRSQPADAIFGGWLSIALNMPALVTIVLCYVWFGLSETAAIVAVTINKAPTVAAIMREGARALDRQLLETTQVFGVSRWKVLRHVVLPQLAPSFIASARAGLALTWKIVLVVELLGRPNGVGFQIRTFFNYFDIAGILAYSLAFIAIVLAIETFIMQPIERRTGRWRTA
jgi:NitT/TauT family transport system permease protein